MRLTTSIALIAATLTLPAVAQKNLFELKQEKTEEFVVTKSSYTIDIASSKSYDKYIISVSGDGGYSQQYESKYPSLDMSEFNLPYDGSYNYEIRAVKYVAEMKETLNNGRAAGARGKISVVDVSNGQFSTQNNMMKIYDQARETTLPNLPTIKQ